MNKVRKYSNKHLIIKIDFICLFNKKQIKLERRRGGRTNDRDVLSNNGDFVYTILHHYSPFHKSIYLKYKLKGKETIERMFSPFPRYSVKTSICLLYLNKFKWRWRWLNIHSFIFPNKGDLVYTILHPYSPFDQIKCKTNINNKLNGARKDECTFVWSPNDKGLTYALLKRHLSFIKP